MGPSNKGKWILAGLVVAAGFTLPAFTAPSAPKPQRRDFDIVARKYAYEPAVIHVNQGDEVHVKFASKDVVHGFYLEGYDIDALAEPGKAGIQLRHPSVDLNFTNAQEIVFTADKRGKFRYRCSMTCGYMHPFMMGVMIVEPNSLFGQALGLMVGLLLAGFILAWPSGLPKAVRSAAEGAHP
jgi:heme/copper-type cytochrome/quinol oxidase subunit 2